MFIRRRTHNRPLASILLVVFLFTSAFTQSSGVLSTYLKSFGCSFEKSKSAAASTCQFPFEKNEKEEKKSEDKTVFLSLLVEAILFTLTESHEHSFYSDPKSSGDSANIPLYLLIRTLRL